MRSLSETFSLIVVVETSTKRRVEFSVLCSEVKFPNPSHTSLTWPLATFCSNRRASSRCWRSWVCLSVGFSYRGECRRDAWAISCTARFIISKYSGPSSYAGKPGRDKLKFDRVRCVGTGVNGFAGSCRRIDSCVFGLLFLAVSIAGDTSGLLFFLLFILTFGTLSGRTRLLVSIYLSLRFCNQRVMLDHKMEGMPKW